MDEVEINQSRVEPGEIMDINPDCESQFENSDEPETFESKGKFFKCYLKSSIKKNIKPRAYTRHCLKDTSEKKIYFSIIGRQYYDINLNKI
ncbi:hypothetical protein TNCV_368931 [Trichonephila clavipes]|nr:hypothetical protein TNCV_368931 [Trichonephila clavipes]